jgi:hypothetical protein
VAAGGSSSGSSSGGGADAADAAAHMHGHFLSSRRPFLLLWDMVDSGGGRAQTLARARAQIRLLMSQVRGARVACCCGWPAVAGGLLLRVACCCGVRWNECLVQPGAWCLVFDVLA